MELKVFSVCIGYAPFVLPFLHNAVPSCFLYVLVCEDTGVLIKLLGFFGCILSKSVYWVVSGLLGSRNILLVLGVATILQSELIGTTWHTRN